MPKKIDKYIKNTKTTLNKTAKFIYSYLQTHRKRKKAKEREREREDEYTLEFIRHYTIV